MRDGPLAEAIVGHLAEAGGLVTADDLAAYRPIERRARWRSTTAA